MTRDEELALIDEAILAGKLTRVKYEYDFKTPIPPNAAIGRKNGRRKNGRNRSAEIREKNYRKAGIPL